MEVTLPPGLGCQQLRTHLIFLFFWFLLKVIRRVASMGKTCVCTIHQPSASIFAQFDSVLLLNGTSEPQEENCPARNANNAILKFSRASSF
jgi:hypothetical protein